ncbi:MAG: VTT domain-containing protein [Nanoarchaeota archaeon]|nr:VTT domain-containing protein [Nanoarchaeota archaeon]MBU1704211.1 VTT domain-containing protein [Nanoarchaeota archaeon]
MAKLKLSKKKVKISGKIIVLIMLALALVLIYYNRSALLVLLEKNATLWSVYQHISFQIAQKTLLGLFYACFFGAIFFISLPVEFIFIYYALLGKDYLFIVLIATLGSLLGMIFNYLFGFVFGERLLKSILKKNFDKFSKKNERWATPLVFIGNLIPFPIEPIALILGAAKYSFRKFIIWTTFGRLGKFIVILLAKDWIVNVVLPWFSSLF